MSQFCTLYETNKVFSILTVKINNLYRNEEFYFKSDRMNIKNCRIKTNTLNMLSKYQSIEWEPRFMK